MKKFIALLTILFLFVVNAAVLAAPNRPPHRYPQRSSQNGTYYRTERTTVYRDWYQDSHWRSRPVHREYRSPYQWRSHRPSHHGRLIIDVHWNQRFPRYRSYWHEGPGFWYRGTEYRRVVLFYDEGDRLASFGFWRNERFVVIRHDDSRYDTQDHFFNQYRGDRISGGQGQSVNFRLGD